MYQSLMIKFFAAILVLFALLSSTFAGETAWVELTPDARIRMISSDVLSSDNSTLVGIEVEMPTSMKTYWRIPGETGIPTEMDVSRSNGVGSSQIIWPYPLREFKDGYLDFVYYGHTILPVELEINNQRPVLEADIVMGVCSDICVPVRASFSLSMNFAHPDRGHGVRLKQAFVLAPEQWSGSAKAIGKIVFAADTGRLDVEIDDTIVDPGSLIVDNGNPEILFSMPQKGPTSGIVSLQMLGKGQNDVLQDKPVRLTFMTSDGAFDLTRVVQTPGS